MRSAKKTPSKSNESALTNFFFELGMLKKIEHCGLKFAGVKNPDTLAEHSHRTAAIGYALALEEGCNAEKTALMCVFHDIGEVRIGDTHRIASRYLKTSREAEREAMNDQTNPLPHALKTRIRALWEEFHAQKTHEAKTARDADLLETIFQAKEYMDVGFKTAERWLSNAEKHLTTKTAKQIFAKLESTKFTDWWDALNIA